VALEVEGWEEETGACLKRYEGPKYKRSIEDIVYITRDIRVQLESRNGYVFVCMYVFVCVVEASPPQWDLYTEGAKILSEVHLFNMTQLKEIQKMITIHTW
jgi:hypothetical protein